MQEGLGSRAILQLKFPLTHLSDSFASGLSCQSRCLNPFFDLPKSNWTRQKNSYAADEHKKHYKHERLLLGDVYLEFPWSVLFVPCPNWHHWWAGGLMNFTTTKRQLRCFGNILKELRVIFKLLHITTRGVVTSITGSDITHPLCVLFSCFLHDHVNVCESPPCLPNRTLPTPPDTMSLHTK